MATATLTKPAAKGGSFLLESPQPGDVFTPADLTDDQKLIGQTAEEFVLKEVFPFIKELENKKPGLMAELVKKGGGGPCLRIRIIIPATCGVSRTVATKTVHLLAH